MKSMLQKFYRDEQGLETVEYAIIAGLIVVATIVTIGLIGDWVAAKFNALLAALNAA